MKPIILAAALAAGAILSGAAGAATLTPVSVTATSTFNNGFYTPNNLINGSGLSGGLHDNFFGNMWQTEQSETDKLAQITFDLGDTYQVDAANIWQFNYADGVQIPGVISTLDRGVKAFRLLTSLDGVTFTEVFNGTLARGTGEPLAAQTFALNDVARYVQIDILSNYAEGTIYTTFASGLSEVQFEGSAITAVPEPAAWALMIGGFGLVGGSLRRASRRPVIA
ncbi:PEPxxWA-CTERM sorting domain-containing protein [Sphingomonas sp. 1P06PA]|uniref:PEPxxWA-CTERM sorting domain-containing protein n=1 Tax=Sphingomonas sp. 1P06PA TaxID=554121 RepID=UPI0039A5E166